MADAGVNVAGLQAMSRGQDVSYSGPSSADVTKFSQMYQSNPNDPYFQMYGAFPSDPGQQSAWFQRAYAGGQQTAEQQAQAHKGGLGDLGLILGIAGLAFGLPTMMDWIGGLGAGGAAGTLAAGGEFIPELGMVADAGTAATAMAGGIDASMLGAGGIAAGGGGGFLSNTWDTVKNLFSGVGGSASNLAMEPGWAEVAGSKGFTDLTAATGSSSFLGNMAGSLASQPWNTVKSLWDVGSGIYGLTQGNKLSGAARTAMQQADPFGSQRGQYQQQLSALMADPSSITKYPGYQAGIEAVQRGMAPYGYSGNTMAALQKYGGQFFNDETARLATLAGAQIAPSSGSQLVEGTAYDLALQGQSLNRIGYGLSRMIG